MIAILRRPEGLVQLVIRAIESREPPKVDAPLDLGEAFVEIIEPLDYAASSMAAQLELPLGRVRRGEDNPETLAAILDVLLRTVPDPGVWSRSTAMPCFDDPDASPRRTAAHPRGFRGTKHQPPKPRSIGPIDLLAFLDGGHHEAALLQRLGRHRERAVAMVEFAEMFASRGEGLLRPFGQAWPVEVGERILAMPAEFRRLFAGALLVVDADTCAGLIAAYWALDLEHDARLRRAVAKICEFPRIAWTLAWVRVIERVAPHRRAVFAELVVATDADRMIAFEQLAAIIERAEGLCDDRHYRHRMHRLLVTIAKRRSPAYLLDGFELANEYRVDHAFDAQGDASDTPASVRLAMRVIGECDDPWVRSEFALVLWDRCGRLEGFAALLDSIDWTALDPDSAYRLAVLLIRVTHDDLDDAQLAAKWACLRAHALAFAELLVGLDPIRRGKACGHLEEITWFWDDPVLLDRACRRYLELLPRLCNPSCATEPRGARALRNLCRIAEVEWPTIRAAPDASFMRLDSETERSNDDSLIGHGLGVLAERMPVLVARAFVECPVVLLSSAKTLGCIHDDAALALVRALIGTPLFTARPEILDAAALIDLVDATEDAASRSMISRRLREHVEGRSIASAAQIERATARIRASWARVLLARIDAAVIEQLATNLGMSEAPRSPAERHALLFQRDAAEHRRAVRRLLAAHFAGDREFLIQHPVNQRWLAAHPAIDAQLWTRGIDQPCGDRKLAIQTDPLEVLRMGTHVGTCLGLGGGLGYSAAAIMLDINKQVLECRDARGSVLARQLLALTDDEQLVCFEVYPLASSDAIKQLFFDYDRTLARALGVAIHTPDEHGPNISLLLAQAWWFDDPIAVPY